MKVEAVMFDCDGTLVDALWAAYKAEVKAIYSFGGNPPTMEQFKRIVIGKATWHDKYVEYGVKDIPSALNMFYDIYHNANFEMIPGAADILERVKLKDLP